MLTSLRIRNLALIDDVEIPLRPGLTVLTGETGAGKSIIVGALGLILGDRASATVVRQEHEEAEVEALFELPPGGEAAHLLDEMGLSTPEESVLIVRRVVSRAGRNRVYLNGRLATLADLKRCVGPLIDISSQHAHTSLLKVVRHRSILDRFGGLEEPLRAYSEAFERWQTADGELRRLAKAEQDRAQRIDFLRFQLDEIEAIDPQPGEDTELPAERERLMNATLLRDAAQQAESVLHGRRNAVTDELSTVEGALRDAAECDSTLDPLVERLEAARIELEDIAMEARDYRARVDLDPARLEEVDERLEVLRKLLRRHGPELADVLVSSERMAAELAELDNLEHTLTQLQKRVATEHGRLSQAAKDLTRARRGAAERARALVEEQLADLGMPNAQFLVEVGAAEALAPHGGDVVEFLLSPNAGEPPLPLAKIASGGELSRIMLALKHVMAETDSVDCYIFDEVDTGVSGAIGERIGVKLRDTADARQVLCITHLPQVACHAEHQLRVTKAVQSGRTVTRVATLEHAGRVEEIARLLAGLEVTEQARAHAADLLAKAAARIAR